MKLLTLIYALPIVLFVYTVVVLSGVHVQIALHSISG